MPQKHLTITPVVRRWSIGVLLSLGTFCAKSQTTNELEQQLLTLFNQGKYTEAIPIAKKAKEAAAREYGDTSRRYTLSISNLAYLYEKISDFAATEPLYLEIVGIRKKTVGTHHSDYAVALNDLANVYFAGKKYEAAATIYEEALDIQREVYGEKHPEFAVIAKSFANTCYYLHRYPEAIRYYEKCMAVTVATKGYQDPEYDELLETLAVLYIATGDYSNGIPAYQQLAESTKKRKGEKSDEYILLVATVGNLYLETADYTKSLAFMKQSMELALAAHGENHLLYAKAVNNLGALYRKMNDNRQARACYEKAAALRRKLGGEQDPEYGQTLNNLAELEDAEGNYATAEKLYLQSIAIIKKNKGENDLTYALHLNNLSMLYLEMGRNQEAETLQRQVMKIRRAINGEQTADYAQSLNNLALVLDNLGRYPEAEMSYQQSLSIRKKIFGEVHPLYAQTISNMGALYKNMGRFQEAARFFEQALSIRKKTDGEQSANYARVVDNLASLNILTGSYTAAEKLFEQAIAIRQHALGTHHPDYATSLNNLGALLVYTGRFNEGEKIYNEVISIYKQSVGDKHPSYGLALQNLGEIYRRQQRLTLAESVLRQAMKIRLENYGAQSAEMATPLASLANVYIGLRQFDKAEQLLDSSNALMFHHVQNNFANLSEDEKMQWWNDEASRFELAPSLLISNPRYSTSFLLKTFSRQLELKGFVLKDGKKIIEQVRQQGSPSLKAMLTEWQTNKASLVKQYSLPLAERSSSFDSLVDATNRVEKNLNQQSTAFRAAQSSNAIGFDAIKAKLSKDEAAIEFIRFTYFHEGFTDSILYAAFIVRPDADAPVFVPLCTEAQLGALLDSRNRSSENFVRQTYRGLEGQDRSTAGARADSLYRLVWKPLEASLAGIQRIHMAPAGLLNRLAFNALSIDSNHYLIDRYQLQQYNSIRQLAENDVTGHTGDGEDIVLFGGVNFEQASAPTTNVPATRLPGTVQRSGSSVWVSLPGTLQEVNTIARFFRSRQRNAITITGSEATEERLKTMSGHSPRILHLSTHGYSLANAANSGNQFSRSDNPLFRSGIILAGANAAWTGEKVPAGREDGIVTAYEIADLDLSKTELVVLSACETALGDIKGTEGVFGLQRAFRLAGVQQMIMSLWQVPDRETAELMTLFYSNKLSGKTTAESFHAAQEAMRKKYPVYYWAAFILVQ